MQSMIKKYSHIPVSEGKEIEVEFMDDVNEGDKVVIKREFENIIKNPVGLTGIPKSPATYTYCSVAISRDGNYVAVTSYDGSPYINVYKKSTTGWDKLTVNDVPAGTYFGVGLSDDGTYLVASLNTSPYIVFFENTDDVYNKLSDPTELPPQYARVIAITPDNYVLYHECNSPYNLRIYNIATRDLISKNVPYAQPSYYYDIYYGERTLIAIAMRYSIYLYEYTGNGSLTALTNKDTGNYAYSCAFSTDGRYISTGLKTYEIVDNSLVEVPRLIAFTSIYSMCGISPASFIHGGTNQLYYLEIINGKVVYTNTISIGSGSNHYGTKRAGNTFISGWSDSPYGMVFERDTEGVNKAYKSDKIFNVNGYGISLHSARKGQVGRALVLWDDGSL